MDTKPAERAAHRVELELQNRVGMLCVHGGILVAIGLMMVLTGAPIPAEEWYGWPARYVMGGAALLAGVTLLIGVAKGDDDYRGWVLMVGGTAAACLWHIALVSLYSYSATTEDMALLSVGEAIPDGITSRAYIPLVYLGYVMLTVIHNATLVRLGPPPRP